MQHPCNVGCVLMAAGNSARFGKNKLLAPYRGRPLAAWAMDAIAQEVLTGTVVVTQYDEIAALGQAHGFTVIRNHAPERGISHTVRLGTEALCRQCDGILYQVADQPLLQRQTVRRLVETFWAAPERIIVPTADGRRGNPCIFPADLFAELTVLEGDRGGSQVIRAHPERVRTVEVAGAELFDVDTAQAFCALPE